MGGIIVNCLGIQDKLGWRHVYLSFTSKTFLMNELCTASHKNKKSLSKHAKSGVVIIVSKDNPHEGGNVHHVVSTLIFLPLCLQILLFNFTLGL